MRRVLTMSLTAILALPAVPLLAGAQAAVAKCVPGTAGIKLPAGFCATIFADSIRGARQLSVAPNGDVFVSVQGRTGAGVVSLRDTNHDGKADTKEQFASGFTSSAVALFGGYLYTESVPLQPPGTRLAPGATGPTISIVRYPLKAGSLTPSGPAETIVSGLPGAPGHSTRNFVISRAGVLYVNVGSPTNSCQPKDRVAYVPGENPCTALETRAGVWKFDAGKKDQTEATGVHMARGIRNAVGIALHPGDEALWTTQHGRDQLGDWRDSLHLDAAAAVKYNAENPAEELMQVNQGDDFGWPYCYYAVADRHLVLAPEYGGNGKTVGQCAQKKEPVATFPGHWAPNALFFYTGSNFPARYKSGAFIAFHGSWNRAPEPQAGFNVVFQPLNGRLASGKYEVFADGFAPNVGASRATAAHRPTGLAQGPDGALYVTDDAMGRIYKIVYTGK
jgi:glucose/arabinose dehydrogenase